MGKQVSAPGPPPMCFTGSMIDRSAAMLKQKTRGFFNEVLNDRDTRFMLLHRGAALCHGCKLPEIEGSLEPHWLHLEQLLQASVRLELPPDVTAIDGHDINDVKGTAVTVLLGHVPAEADDGTVPGWRVAVEWGLHSDAEAEALVQRVASGGSGQLLWCGGRDLYHRMRWTDAAAVGHAISATGWHLKALHCGISGQKTVPIEAGAKRSSIDRRTCRIYPRIDPCCIMLVVSKDRTRCLLSHPKRLRPGVWTCLAGFIDSGESVEEAVRREAMEEAGIVVSEVELVTSQPWPLGRGGAELMIACKAVAYSSKILVGDTAEYAGPDDVRWFTRPEAEKMLAAAREAYWYNAPFAQGQRQLRRRSQQQMSCDDGHTAPHPKAQTLLTPGPYAVAYHLIKNWLDEDTAAVDRIRRTQDSSETVVPVRAMSQTGKNESLFHTTWFGEGACMFLCGVASASGLWTAVMCQHS